MALEFVWICVDYMLAASAASETGRALQCNTLFVSFRIRDKTKWFGLDGRTHDTRVRTRKFKPFWVSSDRWAKMVWVLHVTVPAPASAMFRALRAFMIRIVHFAEPAPVSGIQRAIRPVMVWGIGATETALGER